MEISFKVFKLIVEEFTKQGYYFDYAYNRISTDIENSDLHSEYKVWSFKDDDDIMELSVELLGINFFKKLGYAKYLDWAEKIEENLKWEYSSGFDNFGREL